MLIVPAHKPFNRRNFPAVTLLLVLVNCLVYFGWQANDQHLYRQAVQFYLDSDLPSLEWPRYVAFVEAHDPDAHQRAQELDRAADGEAGEEDGRFTDEFRFRVMLSHQAFQQALDEERIIPPADPDFERWRPLRDEFEALWSRPFTERYALEYTDPRPATLISHMFMHGNVGHLVGNMVFLVMLGLLVEGALGGRLYLVAYLLGGLGAAAASLALRAGGASGLVGASGAIAGLMGLYAVLYNTRPVRFFYWAFVYFDYVKKPAIVLLPLWLGWELLQLYLAGGRGVAYEAHAGGIVTGALMGGAILALGWQRQAFLDEDVKRDADRDTLDQAMADLRELRVARAKQGFKRLLDRHGNDPELLRTYYGACKIKVRDPDLLDAARRIFRLNPSEPAARAVIVSTAADFVQRPERVAELPPATLARLTVNLATWGEVDAAKALLENLRNKAAGDTGLQPAVARASLWIGRHLHSTGASESATPFLESAVSHAPESADADEARRLLAEIV